MHYLILAFFSDLLQVWLWKMCARMRGAASPWRLPISASVSQDTQAATVKKWWMSACQTRAAMEQPAETIRAHMSVL